MDYLALYQALPTAFGEPSVSAVFKRAPEDFIVIEQGGFFPTGDGDHLALRIRKTNLTTHDIVESICRYYKVHDVDVGYSGQKDKRAVTEQWFTVHLPGLNITSHDSLTLPALPSGVASGVATGAEVLSHAKHNRKLRHGTHTGNQFVLTLRDVTGAQPALHDRIRLVREHGFPNYYGAQRFGIGHRNLVKAESLFRDTKPSQKTKPFKGSAKKRISRAQRSLYLSAARSFLFNQVLATRIHQGNWLMPLPEERLMLDGSRSFFQYRHEPDIQARLDSQDIHTTGPLWGNDTSENANGSTGVVITEWERSLLTDFALMTDGLERAGLTATRRALRCLPKKLTCDTIDESTVKLTFELPPGSFATALLKELLMAREDR